MYNLYGENNLLIRLIPIWVLIKSWKPIKYYSSDRIVKSL